jgi:hypothetical protein
LSGNDIINHKTHKTEQNHGFFHRNKSYFECKYRLFRKKYVTLQQNQTRKSHDRNANYSFHAHSDTSA